MNKMNLLHKVAAVCLLSLLVYGCATTSTTIKKPTPKKPVKSVNFDSLKHPPKNWQQLDQEFTHFPGISSKLAYKYVLSKRTPKQQVIVAVLDGGVDIHQEDLHGHIWKNKGEIPHNGKDDDHNGYADDVHGWNFIGGPDGNVHYDTFVVTRIYKKLYPKYHDADTTGFTPKQLKKYHLFQKVQKDYGDEINKLLKRYHNIEDLEQSKKLADSLLTQHFDGRYSYEDLQKLQPDNQRLAFAKNVMNYVMKNDIDSALIAKRKKDLYHNARYGYNPNYDSRDIVNDNPHDVNQHDYGNNQVDADGPMHGTHVSGIIAAIRNNGIGMNGIADSVLIMPIRIVPDGDERDKDIASGIRYAVDNGADIINMSFGKRYSPHQKVVDQAIEYADEHGVLMVHAAGNSSDNTDKKPSYPTDQFINKYVKNIKSETPNLWLSVGASSWKPDSNFAASFSNYGQKSVDLFAPGVDIYSTVLDNKYKRESGTSMAAPVVSAAAAVVMEYFPKLSKAQVKKVLMKSVTTYPGKKVIYPHKQDKKGEMGLFSKLSVSGGVVNLFSALQLAQKMSR
jgi:subtilisin family serine protease